MTLFEIVDEFKNLYEMICDGVDQETLEGTLESLTAELEVKSEGYVAVINQLDMEAKKAGEIIDKYTAIKRARENGIKAMKEKLLVAMKSTDKKEIDAGDFTIKIQKNGGQQPLKITGEVPDNMTKITIEPDKDKIREYLKDHDCGWAHLEERGSHIVIR